LDYSLYPVRYLPLFTIFCCYLIKLNKYAAGSFVDTKIPRAIWSAVAGGTGAAFTSFKSTLLISIYTVIASQLVGNVALVIMASDELVSLPADRQRFGWLLLSWISTVAGNFTLTGSAANIIVCEKARRHKRAPVDISAKEHFRECGILTLVSIVVGVLVLYLEARWMGYLTA
jgi:Na+/H+ antiporter NhaD/arsenite permease-like protein